MGGACGICFQRVARHQYMPCRHLICEYCYNYTKEEAIKAAQKQMKEEAVYNGYFIETPTREMVVPRIVCHICRAVQDTPPKPLIGDCSFNISP